MDFGYKYRELWTGLQRTVGNFAIARSVRELTAFPRPYLGNGTVMTETAFGERIGSWTQSRTRTAHNGIMMHQDKKLKPIPPVLSGRIIWITHVVYGLQAL